MRDVRVLQGSHVVLREIDAVVREAPEQDADVARLHLADIRSSACPTLIAALSTSHSMNAATAAGEHSLMRTFDRLRCRTAWASEAR